MIQRIQTLYLLLATLCTGALLLLPMAHYTDGAAEYTIKAFSISDGENTVMLPMIYLGILVSLAALVPFATIFMFKNRMLQVRLCVTELVLLVGSAIMAGIYLWMTWRAISELPFGEMAVDIWVLLPLLSVVFVVLAARAVFRDELLVRSLDRIR